MARILEDKTNTEPVSATYPYGNIKNDSGAADGTPVDADVYADFHQFFARLIDKANNPAITINNLPDNAVNGFQFYEALLATKTNLAIENESNLKYLNGVFNEELPSEAFGLGVVTNAVDVIVLSEKSYVLDAGSLDIFVFDLVTGANIPGENINLSTEASNVTSFFQYNSKFYVLSSTDKFIYVYDLSTGANIPAENINLAAMSSLIRGVFVVNDKAYICDLSNNEIAVYNILTGVVIPSETLTGATAPLSVFIVGDYAFISTNGSGIFVYQLSTQTQISNFGAAVTTNGFKIQIVGNKAYICDGSIYVFDIVSEKVIFTEETANFGINGFTIQNNKLYFEAGNEVRVLNQNILTTYI